MVYCFNVLNSIIFGRDLNAYFQQWILYLKLSFFLFSWCLRNCTVLIDGLSWEVTFEKVNFVPLGFWKWKNSLVCWIFSIRDFFFFLAFSSNTSWINDTSFYRLCRSGHCFLWFKVILGLELPLTSSSWDGCLESILCSP